GRPQQPAIGPRRLPEQLGAVREEQQPGPAAELDLQLLVVERGEPRLAEARRKDDDGAFASLGAAGAEPLQRLALHVMRLWRRLELFGVFLAGRYRELCPACPLGVGLDPGGIELSRARP